MVQAILGTSPTAFIIITIVIVGLAAFLTGQAVANTWKPYWQVLFYAALLGAVARFLIYGLAGGQLLSLSGYLVGTMLVSLIASFAYVTARARKMVNQYPWLYERTGLFSWRTRDEEQSIS